MGYHYTYTHNGILLHTHNGLLLHTHTMGYYYTYTQWDITTATMEYYCTHTHGILLHTVIRKKGVNAICSNVGGPRKYT